MIIRLLLLLLMLSISPSNIFAELSYPDARARSFTQRQEITSTRLSKEPKFKKKRPRKTKAVQDPGILVSLIFGGFFVLLFGTFLFIGLTGRLDLGLAALVAYGGLSLLLLLYLLILSLIRLAKRRRRKKPTQKERQPYSFE